MDNLRYTALIRHYQHGPMTSLYGVYPPSYGKRYLLTRMSLLVIDRQSS